MQYSTPPAPMWRVWRAGQPDGAYWYVTAKDADDAKKQIAREFKAKPDEFDTRAPTPPGKAKK